MYVVARVHDRVDMILGPVIKGSCKWFDSVILIMAVNFIGYMHRVMDICFLTLRCSLNFVLLQVHV